MSEEKKEECCGVAKKGCCGIKKLILGIVLVGLIFTCGYILGKGYCPFAASSCHQGTCPMMKH